MNNQELVAVYRDTVEQVASGLIQTNSITTKHTVVEFVSNPGYNGNIKTINADTITAAQHYAAIGKTCVLNMASAKKAGGGVANGARAQEECLFRASNLFETVLDHHYPLKYDTALYTKDAVFFKDGEYNPITPFVVDVVTIAAVNLNPAASYDEVHSFEADHYEDITYQKIQLMLHLAYTNGCKNIILGAWGCGVFKNEPTVIARLFKEALADYGGFDNVIFAVINDHNSTGDNFDVFSSEFQ